MWDRTLIESKGFGNSARRFWSMPAAAMIHVALVVAIVLSSYWKIEAVEAPAVTFKYVQVDLKPVQLGGGRVQSATKTEKRPVQQSVQPREVEEMIDQPDAPDSSEIDFSGTAPDAPPCPGDPNGVPGGDEDGSVNSLFGIAPPINDDEPIVISAQVQPPVLIHRVEPEYPRIAAIAHICGMVILEAVITKQGTVEQVKTLRSDNPLLENAAIDAVLKWRYRPAMVQNHPVAVYFTVTVRFHFR
jgi:TonB family protein